MLLTFKQPPTRTQGQQYGNGPISRHKVREEFELEIGDPAVLAKIFQGLGMSGWFRYEKHRTTFQLPASQSWARGLLIELDETPIGTFVELEGPAEAIDRAAELLGFSKHDYILKNYLVLYVDECRKRGVQPSHMLFEKSTASSKSHRAKK
jgi:adenylate cyclase, class 2